MSNRTLAYIEFSHWIELISIRFSYFSLFLMTISKIGQSNKVKLRSLYIGDAKSGEIWKPIEWKKIMAGYVKKGSLLNLYIATPPSNNSLIQRTITIGAFCYSRELSATIPILEGLESKKDFVSYSYALAIADQRGNIYVLDFIKNKY